MNLANISVLCFAACYAIAFALELWMLRTHARLLRMAQQGITLAGITAQVVYASQHSLSFTSGSSSLILLSLVLAIFYFSGSLHYRRFVWGLFVLPVVLLLILFAWLRPDGGTLGLPPQAALDGWIRLHILLILAGFVGLCVAFLASAMYLVQASLLRRKVQPGSEFRLLSLERLDAMNRRSVLLAFPLLSSGLVIGALLLPKYELLDWHDPKILATLPVWLVVAMLLVMRYWLHSPPRRLAWVSILCFFLMLLSMAVPWLWPSSHPSGGLRP